MPKICRVVVVEDNADIRELLGNVFEREGYRFAMVEGGDGLRQALLDGDVDVVVIDVLLRRESGLDLAREAGAAGCGVVLTTGDHSYAERLAASGHKHILKPYRLGELLAVVEAALEESRINCTIKHRRFGLDSAQL
jgi:two-component system OmpR family response regulator